MLVYWKWLVSLLTEKTDLMLLYDQIQETVAFLKSKTTFQPRFGIILGTGLSDLVQDMNIVFEIPYGEISHFPVSTVEGHSGKLIFGYINSVPVVVMSGRFHYYEGYSMKQVTFPVRVMKFLGIERLIISNVSGSVNPDFEAGDVVFVRDHINLHAENPLRGENDERLGPRFPDMLHTYDRELNQTGISIAKKYDLRAHEGVYLGLQGPNLETPAEYRFANIIGADVIGMSTVPEVIVAAHMSLPILVISLVSNKCFPIEEIGVTTIESVIAMAKERTPKMLSLIHI